MITEDVADMSSSSSSSNRPQVSVYPASVANDGTTTANVAINLKTALPSKYDGIGVTLESKRAALDTLSASSSDTNSSGVAQFTVKSSTLGTANLTVSVPSQSLVFSAQPKVLFLGASPYVDFQAQIHNGLEPGSNTSSTKNIFKDVYTSGVTRDGILNNFAFDSTNGWVGVGTASSPYALLFDGSTHSSYVDFGSSFSTSDVSFEAWIKPAQVSSKSTVILGNGSSVLSGASSTDRGLTLSQSPTGNGALQLTVGGPSYVDEVLADSPSGYWRLGESSGTTATDISGNSRNGTFVSSPTLAQSGALSGSSDLAVQFSGSNYVDLGQPAALAYDRTTPFTVEAWIKTAGSGTIISKMSDNGSTPMGWGLHLWSGQIAIELNSTYCTNCIQVWSSSTALADNNWHHIVFSYDGSSTRGGVVLYVDGAAATIAASPNNNSLSASFANSVSLRIGSRATPAGAATAGFSGRIDEVALYSSVLSLARVQAHYAARLRSTCMTSTALTNGTWAFVSGAFTSSTSTLSLLINGTSECSFSNASGGLFANSPSSMRVGTNPSGTKAWSGSLSDFRLYSTPLSTATFQKNYDATKARFGF